MSPYQMTGWFGFYATPNMNSPMWADGKNPHQTSNKSRNTKAQQKKKKRGRK